MSEQDRSKGAERIRWRGRSRSMDQRLRKMRDQGAPAPVLPLLLPLERGWLDTPRRGGRARRPGGSNVSADLSGRLAERIAGRI